MSRWTSPCACAAARPGRGLHADPQDRGQVERPGAVDPLLERGARDELHHQVGQPLPLVHRVDRHDVLVADRRRGPGLAGEPLPGRAAGGKLRCQHLDGDRPVQRRVERLEDDPHAPFAQHLEHAIRGQLAQFVRGVGRIEEGEDLARIHRRETGRVRVRLRSRP